ncbi:thioesterase II family protein [Salinispora arenicola]|uniref:thioesterase II family protein n=1 Tax=Salinispora arenicola TaxID=168697 RepID=UPI00037542D9|nr:alpha/beta fold hydrolase [Salinispora arenicola]
MSPWLVELAGPPLGTRLVVCIPPAGGGAGRFGMLRPHLDTDIRLLGVQLPGREQRWHEEPVRTMAAAVAAIVPVLVPSLTVPYVLYGQSMGGLLGYELAHALSALARPPAALVLAAIRPPHLVTPDEARHAATDTQLRVALDAQLADPAFADDEDVAELLMTSLRADARLCANYRHDGERNLTCPVVGWAGRDDRAVTEEHMRGWRRYTRGPFQTAEMPGDHYFTQTHPERTALALQDPAIWAGRPADDGPDERSGNARLGLGHSGGEAW